MILESNQLAQINPGMIGTAVSTGLNVCTIFIFHFPILFTVAEDNESEVESKNPSRFYERLPGSSQCFWTHEKILFLWKDTVQNVSLAEIVFSANSALVDIL